jgi:hypothetical protein
MEDMPFFTTPPALIAETGAALGNLEVLADEYETSPELLAQGGIADADYEEPNALDPQIFGALISA